MNMSNKWSIGQITNHNLAIEASVIEAYWLFCNSSKRAMRFVTSLFGPLPWLRLVCDVVTLCDCHN